MYVLVQQKSLYSWYTVIKFGLPLPHPPLVKDHLFGRVFKVTIMKVVKERLLQIQIIIVPFSRIILLKFNTLQGRASTSGEEPAHSHASLCTQEKGQHSLVSTLTLTGESSSVLLIGTPVAVAVCCQDFTSLVALSFIVYFSIFHSFQTSPECSLTDQILDQLKQVFLSQ